MRCATVSSTTDAARATPLPTAFPQERVTVTKRSLKPLHRDGGRCPGACRSLLGTLTVDHPAASLSEWAGGEAILSV
jgi:hypothetical protein